MNELDVKRRLEELTKAVRKADKILETTIEGHLEVFKQGDRYRYLLTEYKTEEDKTIRIRKYIRKSEQNKAQRIAQRDYAKLFVKSAKEEIRILENLDEYYKGVHAHTLYSNIHPGRKIIVDPILLTDEEYAIRWQESRSDMVNSYPITSEIYTEKGEHVRSKTEKIIADKLNLMGVPYKYEEALQIRGEVIFPDFTILNKKERKVYYWEHYGRIDYEDYRNKMVKKNETYSRNHIVSGDNLITTFETLGMTLSTSQIENIIKQNFM